MILEALCGQSFVWLLGLGSLGGGSAVPSLSLSASVPQAGSHAGGGKQVTAVQPGQTSKWWVVKEKS